MRSGWRRGNEIILGARALDVELVLEARAAAALDADAQHGAVAFRLQDLPNAPGSPFGDGDVFAQFRRSNASLRGLITPQVIIVRWAKAHNQTVFA